MMPENGPGRMNSEGESCHSGKVHLPFAPALPLLALLKHPLMRLGAMEGKLAHAIGALEKATLRGPRPSSGTVGVIRALATFRDELAKLRRKEASALHWSDPRTALTNSDLDLSVELMDQVSAALAPLETVATPSAATRLG